MDNMQRTNGRAAWGGRHAYFKRIADHARDELARAERDLNDYQRQAAGLANVPFELANRIADAGRRVREYRTKMTNALHNAGRN